MKIDKRGMLLGASVLFIISGCTDQNDDKAQENITAKTELSKELQQEVLKPLFSINDQKYGADTLPKLYSEIPGQKRKIFLDTYINYFLMLNQLKKEQNLYEKQINKKFKQELNLLDYKGVTPDDLMQEMLLKKITLETIAEEEVAKKRSGLEKEIKEFYKDKKANFKYSDSIEVSLITLKEKTKSEEILSELNSTNSTIKQFSNLAKKESFDIKSRIDGGYGGFLTEKGSGKEFFETIWKDQTTHGLLNKIIERDKNFFIFYIHKKKPAGVSSFDEVRNDIRSHLLKKDRNRWIKLKYKKVMGKTKVKIYDNFEENLTL